MKKRALIAMSGGVDSSVAALLMKEQGYDCIGVTMKLYDNDDIGIVREQTCCSLDDIEDARSVANRIGIPYYVVNFKEDFKEKVMDSFVNCYVKGWTPNPCIECNRHLKFEHLYRKAKELNCDVIVTGHYVQIMEEDGTLCMKKAVDDSKDQSYVLYSLPKDMLAHTCFPLGGLTKERVREIAEEYGFINSRKKDSQDICFIPDGNYRSFMEKEYGVRVGSGDFVDMDGKVLGRHNGYYCYTIGQRKGLGIAAKEPYYVVDIKPEENLVVLGSNEDLFHTTLIAENVNWMVDETAITPDSLIQAKVRYRQLAQNAHVEQLTDDKVRVTFDEPQRAITKGQALVMYDGDKVLGGGTIVAVEG